MFEGIALALLALFVVSTCQNTDRRVEPSQ